MILGTGIDIIEIERVKHAFDTERRRNRIFTSAEIECFGENSSRMAGFFSAKEALSKALGTGIREIS
ncbi:MAG TPA: 4'-phosphopantetheinyl transferase, partial [Clostridiaceae bacterium]|nr:4'-phosphopantetheinyl transferase [Clostridiaceae bacterium]